MAMWRVAALLTVGWLAACGGSQSDAVGTAGGDGPVESVQVDELVFEFDGNPRDAARVLEPDELAGLLDAVWAGDTWLAAGLSSPFVRSADGREWTEDFAVSGVPADARISNLHRIDGQLLAIAAIEMGWPEPAQRWLLSSADGRQWDAAAFPEVEGGAGSWWEYFPLATLDATVVLSGVAVDLEADTVQAYTITGPVGGPLEVSFGGPVLNALAGDADGFVGLGYGTDVTTVHRSHDGVEWEEVAQLSGYYGSLVRIGDVLVVGGETAPEDARVAQVLNSRDGGRSWSEVPLDHGLDLGWATLAQSEWGVMAFTEGVPVDEVDLPNDPWTGRAWVSRDGITWVEFIGPFVPDESHEVPILGMGTDHVLVLGGSRVTRVDLPAIAG